MSDNFQDGMIEFIKPGGSMKSKYLLLLFPIFAYAVKEGNSVFFKNIHEGSIITQNSIIHFGVHGMKVVPAGKMELGTGHHHLVIDGDSIAEGEIIPSDPTHLHFGKGQEETQLNLKPGKHKLTLQFADGAHKSYGPDMSQTIHVIVK